MTQAPSPIVQQSAGAATTETVNQAKPEPDKALPSTNIQFGDSEKLTVDVCRSTSVRLILVNGASMQADAVLSVTPGDSLRIEPARVLLQPGRNSVSLTISSDHPSCKPPGWLPVPAKTVYLVVSSAGGGKQDLRAFRMRDTRPPVVGWIPLVVGLLVASLVVLWSKPAKAPTGLRLDQPLWGTSLASNLALGAGLLTALLSLLPQTSELRVADRPTYTQLSLLCPALSAASPLVFGLRSAVDPFKAFLFSALITLWAALGQLVAVMLLLIDLAWSGLFSRVTVLVLEVFSAALFIGLCVYGAGAIKRILEPPAAGVAAQADDALPKSWSLL